MKHKHGCGTHLLPLKVFGTHSTPKTVLLRNLNDKILVYSGNKLLAQLKQIEPYIGAK
jgi:hypothetical protein